MSGKLQNYILRPLLGLDRFITGRARAELGEASRMLVIALIYFVLFIISRRAVSPNMGTPVCWAAGFAMAMAVRYGWRAILAVGLGAFAGRLLDPGAVLPSLNLALGDAAEAALGAWIILAALRGRKTAYQVETLAFLSAAVLAPLVAIILRVLTLWQLPIVFDEELRRYAAQGLGILFLTPVLTLPLSAVPGLLKNLKLAERFIIYGVGWTLTGIIFSAEVDFQFIFLVFPLVLAAFVLLTEIDVKLLALLIAILSMMGTIRGLGPLHLGSTLQNMLCLQLFLFSLGLTALVLVGFRKAGTVVYPSIALVLIWSFTALICSSIVEKQMSEESRHFRRQTEHVYKRLIDRFHIYEDALRGGAGLFASTRTVTRRGWHSYVESLQLIERNPGILGMGVILPLPSQAGRRIHCFQECVPEFEVSPRDLPEGTPGYPAPGQSRYVIVYRHPEKEGGATRGLDVGSDENRRAALETSRDRGGVVISRKIRLLKSPGETGFLMVLPFYRHGWATGTIEERRRAHLGWVYLPFLDRQFFSEVSLGSGDDIEIYAFDGSEPVFKNLLFINRDGPFETSGHLVTTTLNFAQHEFTLGFRRPKHFISYVDTTASWIAALGILISLLSAGLVAQLRVLNRRAEQLASEKTALLGKSEQTVRQLNQELESKVVDRTTELAEMNKLLRRSRERLSAILDQSPLATQIITVEGRVTCVNQAWQTLWEVSDEERDRVTRSSYNILCDPMMLSLGFVDSLKRASQDLPTAHSTTFVRPSDFGRPGSPKWIKAHLSPVKDAVGLVTEIILICQDVTAEVEARNLIRQKQEELQAILDYSPAVIYMKDLNGVYIMVNREFEKVAAARREWILGKTDYDLWPGPVADGFREGDRRIGGLRRAIQTEDVFPQADGLHTYISAKFPIFDESGKVRAICGISTDISEQKRVKEERSTLEVRERSALEASRLKSEFLANMSHEIRTPINGIIGMTRLLSETPLAAEQERFVASIAASSGLLLTLINDILDLSKVEAGKLELELLPFSVEELVRDTREAFQALIEERGLKFSAEMKIESGQYYLGDPSRIRQILNNLIGNALKFTHEGSIRLAVEALPHHAGETELKFTVTDTGIGIPRDVLPRLFDKFSQGDSSTARKFGGTGLGLAISRQLTHLMNGTIQVASEIGHGSSFAFTVRVEALSADDLRRFRREEEGSCDQQAALRFRQNFRVLVAEDNSINAEITLRILNKAGYRAECVANGLEVLTATENLKYDVILMDCQMPEMDGYEATRKLRQEGVQIPIIALTANAFKADRERCLEAGMSDYLSKPLDPSSLVKAIDRWLRPRGAPAAAAPVVESGTEVLQTGGNVIDLQTLQRLDQIDDDGGHALIKKLYMMYCETMPEGLRKMRESLASSISDVSREAHALKSCNANLGVRQAVHLLQKIEDGRVERREMVEALNLLEKQFQEARIELQRYIKGFQEARSNERDSS